MNGLFAIDDTADADSMDNTNHQSGQLSRDQINILLEMADKVNKETVTLVAKKVDDLNAGTKEPVAPNWKEC